MHTYKNHRDFKSQVTLNLNILCVHTMLMLKYVYNVYLCPCDKIQAPTSLNISLSEYAMQWIYMVIRLVTSIYKCFKACISVYKHIQVHMLRDQVFKLPQAWSKRKSSIALIAYMKMYVYSIFRVNMVYNVFKVEYLVLHEQFQDMHIHVYVMHTCTNRSLFKFWPL